MFIKAKRFYSTYSFLRCLAHHAWHGIPPRWSITSMATLWSRYANPYIQCSHWVYIMSRSGTCSWASATSFNLFSRLWVLFRRATVSFKCRSSAVSWRPRWAGTCISLQLLLWRVMFSLDRWSCSDVTISLHVAWGGENRDGRQGHRTTGLSINILNFPMISNIKRLYAWMVD